MKDFEGVDKDKPTKGTTSRSVSEQEQKGHHHGHEHHHHHDAEAEPEVSAWLIVVTIGLTIGLQFLPESVFPLDGWLRLLLYLGVYLLIGWHVLAEAAEGIVHGELFDENFLMAIATIGAFALALYQGNGEYTEAIAVMLFFQIGEYFQSYAVNKSRGSISALMDIRPDYATIESEGALQRVSPDEVSVGQTIVVQPGEKVPIDGVVTEGYSQLNTAALTGESLPREVQAGDEVISGSVNMTGVLRICTTKAFGDSTVSKILELVQNSNEHQSESEAFITRFARYYTPIVCGCALALALLPPLVALMTGDEAAWNQWMYRALTFLVISCPCALVISIPLSFFAGIGGASRQGVLIKGADYLEALAKVDTVVFDKTGTLTQGVFKVIEVCTAQPDTDGEGSQQLLRLAAMAECCSSHPISLSLREAYGEEIDQSLISDIQELSGYGVTATVDHISVAAGNMKLMNRLGLTPPPCTTAGTIVHVAIGGDYAGHIVLGDVEKPQAKTAVEQLRGMGVTHTVMLTGDSKVVAQQVGEQLGIAEVHAELLPDQKVEELERLMAHETGKGRLAFVGDGINDAPVLSRAHIGIAMGALGSDAAIEAADVVLMDDDPAKISTAIGLSRRCLRIVWQNIIFAIGVKLLCMLLGAMGVASMWFAIFADVGVMVICVLNAIRCLRIK